MNREDVIRVPATTQESLGVWINAASSPTAHPVAGGLTSTAAESDEVAVWNGGSWSGRTLNGNQWEALVPISGLTKGTRYNLWVRVTTGAETPVMHAGVVEAF